MKKIAKQSVSSPYMRYVLIFTLVVLLGFAMLYVYNIQKTVQEKFDGQYQITYVYKEGCFFCNKFNPVWDQWVAANSSTHKGKKIEQANATNFTSKYGINGFPTVVIEDANGNFVDKKVGYTDYNSFQAFVDTNTSFVA